MSGIPAGAGSLLGKRLGKYEILALLALGGTAEIYLARIGGAAGFEKYVVVKCLHDHLADDQEFVKMFLDEARLAAHLDHSNIVQTMELGEHENRYYMVMEFLAGLSLAMIVRRATERLPGGRVPTALALNMVAQSCAGLHYAHERSVNGKVLNIVHRDISPQNLVVSFEGVVKVVDFGIAKAELRETKTRSGTIKGKFAYMSPEQCVATNVDRRTDVFALGVILWELLTGRRLFKRNSPYETYQAVIECKVEAPSKLDRDMDPQIDAIVMKALAKEKEQRFPTAEAFGDAILAYLHTRHKSSGPNDVARWFDAQFSKEIDEHGARMRELIAQAAKDDFSVDTGVRWGEEDEKGNQTVDLSSRSKAQEEAERLSMADMMEVDRASAAGLTGVIDDLDEPGDGDGDEDDIPADRTRIEANPLDRLKELNEAAAAKKAPAPASRAASIPSLVKAGGGAAPAVTSNTLSSIADAPVLPGGAADDDKATIARPSGQGPVPVIPASMQGRVPTPPAGRPAPPVMPPSGALPLPPAPMMAGRTPPYPQPDQAETMLPPGVAHPGSRTYVAQPETSKATADTRPPPMGNVPPRPSGFPAAANLPTMIADTDGVSQVAPVRPPQSPPAPQPPPPSPHAAKATQMHQAQMPPPDGGPMGYPGSHGQHGQQGPQMPPPPQPSPPMQMMPDSASYPSVNPAQLMSPVGQNYQNQVDWAQAAAMPARAIPPWMLAAIFAGVLVGALLVTLLIAKIAS